MKKILRLVIASFSACLMLVCAFAFVACTEKEEGQYTYTIIVQQPNGSAYGEGLEIELRVKGTEKVYSATTDKAGRIECKPLFKDVAEDALQELEVRIKNLPDKYECDENITVRANGSVTIKLRNSNADSTENGWTVFVKTPDGKPYEGIRVQLCSANNGVCYTEFFATDAEGKAICIIEDIDDDVMIVHLYNLPEGCVYDNESDDCARVRKGESVTITLEAEAE